MLFLTHQSNGSPSMHTWVNNTPKVWGEVGDVLMAQGSKSIIVTAHWQMDGARIE